MKGIQTILVGKCFRNVKDGRDMAIFIAYQIDHVGGFYKLVAAKVKKEFVKFLIAKALEDINSAA